MALFAGILRVEDTTALTEVDPVEINDAINQLLARYQRERNEAQSLLVSGEVQRASELVRLAGIDEGQEIGPDGRPLETHISGEYTAGFPMIRYGWALGYNEETAAALTVGDLDRNVTAKVAGNARRHRRDIAKALFGNANYTYTDTIEGAGAVTVVRLANDDGTDFDGDEVDDNENHYLVSNYVAADISATNNPLVTLANEISEHFDGTTRIVAFINQAQRADLVDGLATAFVDADIAGITPAAADARATALGANVPGTFVGVDGASGVYVYVWDQVPSGYILAMTPDAPGPVVRRVPANAALRGFNVRAEEEHYPFYKRTWIERFGYGVRNRLNAAVMQLKASGTYDVPAI